MASNFWKDRSIFVTGATGLLGGWLLQDLIGRRAQVTALVREGSRRSITLNNSLIHPVGTVPGSVEDFGLIRRTLSEYAVDTVFHLAAQAIVGVAKVDPVSTLETNVRGTWNVLEAARLCGVRQVVVASSDKAYGVSADLPYTETHALRGRSPYDASKSCADLICSMYAETYRLPVSIVRCANLFGGGDFNFSRTVPGAIRATLHGERFVIRSDGKFVRDCLYVKDAAEAYLRVAERLAADSSLLGEAFNFSMELRLNVLELVEQILKIMGRQDLRPIIQNNVSHEIREQYLSSAKARTVLGWTPRYSLIEGLAETVAWYRNHFDLQRPLARGAAR